ncbi:granzyme A [Gastrophryne carolinensis]
MEIIGGNEAAPHSRPYMVYLMNGSTKCGGALIKANWVITAAHCKFGNSTKAVLGAHSINNASRDLTFKIKRAIQHPCFDWETKVHDLQLLQLAKPVKLNKIVGLLNLPKQEQNVKPGTLCSTAGWGITDMKRKILSDVLREANLTIVDNRICSKIYSKEQKVKITNSMICAGPIKKRKDDTCQGDSGGPLICGDNFIGIVSFGPPNTCGNPKIPGVYTLLTNSYLKWIRDTTGGAEF